MKEGADQGELCMDNAACTDSHQVFTSSIVHIYAAFLCSHDELWAADE